ncbi:hypothetical protein [Streptomyces sp. NBC_00258]|uniref:hypothetical protein n=1 Tax=Streptomyces sp. NBC_00258 TaxID=2903642 RepID=UPI002E298828|nr:hypothetical protein [Streptomyces sp. NBC_00258]
MMQSPDNLGPEGRYSSRAGLEVESQIALAEYSALRAEVERRANVQWNVFALQVTSAGAISGLAISRASNLVLLLLIPMSSYMLGSRYILHDFHIKLIHRYIRESLSARLLDGLKWDRWKKESFSDVRDRRRFRVTGWTVFQPTRLAFEGVALLALAAATLSAAYKWWTIHPEWILIFGFVAMWIIGVLAIFLLHQSFERASGDA